MGKMGTNRISVYVEFINHIADGRKTSNIQTRNRIVDDRFYRTKKKRARLENNGHSLRYQLIECAFSLRAFPVEMRNSTTIKNANNTK